MARLLAIDWDRLEARIVVGRPQAGGVGIEQAITVPIDLPSAESSVEGLQEQLTKALGSVRVSKAQVLSAIGRSLVELRSMSLPPAPDEELPDMVRFQAMREFSSLKDSSPLDFMPLRDAVQEEGQVMAAAVPSELFEQVREAIVGQGHEPQRCVMRPASAASLALRRHPKAKSGITLVIAQQADSAELAVTSYGTVVFSRSFRLPPNWQPGETGEPLLGEVRRTIAAAQNQLGGKKVDQIVLFGTSSTHASLQDRLSERTKLPVEVIDPFDDVVVGGEMPQHPERFAALVGMLQDEADEVPPVLDFQNPRKRPEPESNRRQVVLFGMAAAAVVLGALFLWWWQHNKLSTQIAQTEFAAKQAKEERRKLQGQVDLAKELDDWKKGDRNWLDLMLHLSSMDGLSADDFRIESLSGKTQTDGRGSIVIRGRARSNNSLQKFRAKMAKQGYDVLTVRRGLDERQDDRYPILFNLEIQSDNYIQFVSASTPTANPATANPASASSTDASESNSSDSSATDSAAKTSDDTTENQPEEA